MFQLQAIINLS